LAESLHRDGKWESGAARHGERDLRRKPPLVNDGGLSRSDNRPTLTYDEQIRPDCGVGVHVTPQSRHSILRCRHEVDPMAPFREELDLLAHMDCIPPRHK